VLTGGCSASKPSMEEVGRRDILVMVYGEPCSYVWAMASPGVAATAEQAIAVVIAEAHQAKAYERGNLFQKKFKDYPARKRVRQSLIREISATGRNAIPICFVGEDPDSGCVRGNNFNSLSERHKGSLVLLAKPCEYGIRFKKPYIAVGFSLQEIETKKKIWEAYLTVDIWELEEKMRAPEKWLASPEEVKSSLDSQINLIAQEVASVIQGKEDSDTGVIKGSQGNTVFESCSVSLLNCMVEREAKAEK